MPADDLQRLVPKLTRVKLSKRLRLATQGVRMPFVYFVEDGIVPLILGLGAIRTAVGMVGREGMVGTSLLYSVDRSALHAEVLIPGSAWRISADDLFATFAASPSLRRFLGQLQHVELLQAQSSTLAAGHLNIEARLARWLLMMHDRLGGSSIDVVHRDVADVVGARRPAITSGLGALVERRLVALNRGVIHIRQRSGLIELAQGTYGQAEAEYARLLGDFRDKGLQPNASPIE
jgi:CRP-like cAMP-binding protein